MAYRKKPSIEQEVEQMKEQLVEKIEKSREPIETIMYEYKTSKIPEIQRFLLDKYLLDYPEFFDFALSPQFANERDLLNTFFGVLADKAEEIDQGFFENILKKIEVPELNPYFRNNLISAVTEILERNSKLFKKYIKRFIEDIVEYSNIPFVFQYVFQMIKDDENLKSLFFNKILENIKDMQERMDNLDEIVHLLKKERWKYPDVTKVLNILADLSDNPKGQIFILDILPDSPKYLKAFMYLAHSKNKKVSELAKDKIKSLKS